MRRLIAAFSIAGACASAQAHPVTFPGNLMVMGEVDRNAQDFNAWHTFAPTQAFGPGFMRFRSEDGAREREVPNLHYNLRAKRWNWPDAQANVYLQAGIGSAKGDDFAGRETVLMPGFQADYETRRIYTAYRWHALRGGPVRHVFNNVQAGFSFYAVDYDDWQPWLILDVRRMSNLGMGSEVTPTFRLIHKSLFMEAGAVDGKRLRLNLMYNFSF